MRFRVGSFVVLMFACSSFAVFAGCAQGVSTAGATGEPTPDESATPTPGESPEPSPTPSGLQRVSVTFTDVYVMDNSEPVLTDPGECLFAVDVNGNYFETPLFNCDDGAAYALNFPTIDLDLASYQQLFISAAGFEDDPVDPDVLGSFDVTFDAAGLFGEGQHVESALFDPQTLGYFEMGYVISIAD